VAVGNLKGIPLGRQGSEVLCKRTVSGSISTSEASCCRIWLRRATVEQLHPSQCLVKQQAGCMSTVLWPSLSLTCTVHPAETRCPACPQSGPAHPVRLQEDHVMSRSVFREWFRSQHATRGNIVWSYHHKYLPIFSPVPCNNQSIETCVLGNQDWAGHGSYSAGSCRSLAFAKNMSAL